MPNPRSVQHGFTGDMESAFGRGQVVTGAAMLTGSVAGGLIAQQTSLGLPFLALSRRRTVRREGLGTSAAPAPQPA